MALIAVLLMPRKLHCLNILLFSLLFYYWSSGPIVIVLALSITLNWALGKALEKRRQKWLLAVGIAINLSTLFYYKYAFFLSEQISLIHSGFDSALFQDIVLPVGISFFTFQAISYLVDIYRQDIKAEPKLIVFGAYLSFFPQLIAGPIVRFKDVIHSYYAPQISTENIAAGATRFTHGLLKKLIIADSAGAIADACFSVPVAEVTTATSLLGALAYSVQIYFDFSAYSDMAIGLGLIFGIRFNENFARPYASSSVTEFWRRWHISLSSWFRDYLYIPLGGNRAGASRTYLNLIIVFLLTGLWHGAAWTFILWGIYHGLFLIIERLILRGRAGSSRSQLARYLYSIPVVMLGWILFRAETLDQATAFFSALLPSYHASSMYLSHTVLQSITPFTLTALALGCITFFMRGERGYGERIMQSTNVRALLFNRVFYIVFGLPLVLVLSFSTDFSPFLYFRF